MSDKLSIWDALCKTDPAHTKQFSRAGGFKGTAIKPIWIVKMLTEKFGPCGSGWGIDEPSFQVVPCGDETMVYCTVRCWYDNGDPIVNCYLYGVGGDKVLAKRSSGPFFDDEAFKKAFTDAVGNAFKFLGVGADVHMGQFEDSKYLQAVKDEFSQRAANDEPRSEPAPRTKLNGPHTSKTDLRRAICDIISKVRSAKSNAEIDAIQKEHIATIKQANSDWPALLTGDPNIPEDVGLKGAVEQRRQQLTSEDDGQLAMLIRSMKECDSPNSLSNWMATNEAIIGELDGAESRTFQLAYDLHESGLKAVSLVNAG